MARLKWKFDGNAFRHMKCHQRPEVTTDMMALLISMHLYPPIYASGLEVRLVAFIAVWPESIIAVCDTIFLTELLHVASLQVEGGRPGLLVV